MTELEKVIAYGHEKILCTHNTTIEITKDNYLTERGTCILGINASKACFDLSPILKSKIQGGCKFKVRISVEGATDFFYGYGNKNLKLLNNKDMVFRKSNFICDRTVLINCTKASSELNRELISKLKITEKKFSIIFDVNDANG